MAKLKWTTWEDLHYNLPDETEYKIGHNTAAYLHPLGKVDIWLHGHKIVSLEHRHIKFSMCGFPTVTTRERLNQFLWHFGATVSQNKGIQLLLLHPPPKHSLYVSPSDSLDILVPDIPCWAIDKCTEYSISESPPMNHAWEVTPEDQMFLHLGNNVAFGEQMLSESDESDLWPLGKR